MQLIRPSAFANLRFVQRYSPSVQNRRIVGGVSGPTSRSMEAAISAGAVAGVAAKDAGEVALIEEARAVRDLGERRVSIR